MLWKRAPKRLPTILGKTVPPIRYTIPIFLNATFADENIKEKRYVSVIIAIPKLSIVAKNTAQDPFIMKYFISKGNKSIIKPTVGIEKRMKSAMIFPT